MARWGDNSDRSTIDNVDMHNMNYVMRNWEDWTLSKGANLMTVNTKAMYYVFSPTAQRKVVGIPNVKVIISVISN